MSETPVDPQQPWPGLASFTEETRGFFYGRDDEITDLARRVQRKLLTILFGQSGLGKTSILNAGIVPRLRLEGYCPVYVRIDYAATAEPSEQIKQAILRATESVGRWTRPGTAIEGESLWEFLHHRDDQLLDGAGKVVTPLVIFDQFEEIFTLAQGDDAGRQRAARFVEDLADLVENRLPKALEAKLDDDESIVERFDFTRGDYRILIALREDYLAHLEGFKGQMPSITQNRMRLARMTGTQALDAVRKPGGALVNEEVAEAIVRFIAGGAELRNAEVEPSLLSLICRELNNARIAQGRAEISADLLAGSHDTILAEFYERALVDQPPALRKVIEDHLLTDSGFRESLAEERVRKAFAGAGAAPDALATLVNRRLLRIEERLDMRRVELTHDVLCGVVKSSRQLRLEREALEEAEQQLAAQRDREIATRKALVRARQIATACAVLAIGAVVSAIYGYQSAKRAREAEAKAQQTRQVAETARGESERLLVYLLDDFTRELDPVGRLDIVASLAQRALDYYSKLPPELHTPDTERNRALALVRFAAVSRSRGDFEAGTKAVTEAEAVFRRLRSDGDSTEATAVGLVTALAYRTAILASLRKGPESIKAGEAGLTEIKPLVAASPNPSVAVIRASGELRYWLGYAYQFDDQPQKSVENLRESQQAFRRLGAPDIKDLSVASGYALATSRLAIALDQAEKFPESSAAYEECLEVANRVLDAMPGHATALYIKGLALSNLAGLDARAYRTARALALSRQAESLYEGMIKTAPNNAFTWTNYGAAQQRSADVLCLAGRLEECRDKYRAAVQTAAKVENLGAFSSERVVFSSAILADKEAELGNPEAAAASLANARRVWESAMKPNSSPMLTTITQWGVEALAASVDLNNGNWRDAVKRAREALAGLDALKTTKKEDEQFRLDMRMLANSTIALAEFDQGSPAVAEAASRAALADWKNQPRHEVGAERESAKLRTLAAAAIARQGRLAEAREVLQPALDYHRKVFAKQREDRMQHFEYAQALFVAALATPGQRAALLTQASTILDGLPPVMNRWKSGQMLRRLIAEEQKRPSGG